MTAPGTDYPEIRDQVGKLCARFPGSYGRDLDKLRAYPTEFVTALTEAGYLSVLIPEEFGGSGLPISAAAAILETVQASGCNGAACHAQIYIMGTILRHGSGADATNPARMPANRPTLPKCSLPRHPGRVRKPAYKLTASSVLPKIS